VGFSAPIFSVAIAEIYNSQLHNGIEQKPVACSTAARPADANSVTTAVAHFRLKITSMRQQSSTQQSSTQQQSFQFGAD
jgi:hypothetical protein